MSYQHLPSTSRNLAARWNFPLGIAGFRFADLNRVRRIASLDKVFCEELATSSPQLAEKLLSLRSQPDCSEEPESVELLIEVARFLDDFIGRLFHIEEPVTEMNERTRADSVVMEFKKRFVDRLVLKSPPSQDEIAGTDVTDCEFRYREVVADSLTGNQYVTDPERELAEISILLLDRIKAGEKSDPPESLDMFKRQLDVVVQWTTVLALHSALSHRRKSFTCFSRPEKLDFENLVQIELPEPEMNNRFEGPRDSRRPRDGFGLTDHRMSPREALREMNYCIICHPRDKDSCSKGFPEKGGYRENPLGIPLTGCPLNEKISEAHLLKREGHGIGALAMIMIDNPLCAGTGHRICNDCMKACIFQKQTPVNIPEIETNVLTQVLNLPYGFEIYSLLTRWNPVNLKRPLPLPYNGKNVLVVGMGPAGYTLAHHLLSEGFGVVGIDGLRIEPLSVRMRGAKRRVPEPIEQLSEITGPLDERTILGFGGVSEYGITVRWDKNFLDINYIVLMRRKKFRLYDGIRFGGTLTLENAWELGFDHVALCAGAGRPTIVPMKNNLVRGVRMASDFLMGLQATGVYKRNSLGNLQVQLPAIVIGGGLTAIDTATELQAYYVVQVEKTLDRYERLASQIGEQAIRSKLDEEELEIVETWLKHGHAIRAERAAAEAAGRDPDFNRLVRSWGGVSIVYRKRLQDSPAYRLNHEEVIQCLEEGVQFIERLSPLECVSGPYGSLEAVRWELQEQVDGRWQGTGKEIDLPAKSLMIAAGTHPNTTYDREHPDSFELDPRGEYYKCHQVVAENGEFVLKSVDGVKEIGFLTSYHQNGRFVSYFGDAHPYYAGNVVKAMASAKDGFPSIGELFQADINAMTSEGQPERERDWVLFAEELDEQLVAEVVDAFRLTHQIVEVIVRAPLAARNFHPGEFYRLQNYEAYAEEVQGFKLTMEGIALTGAWVDRDKGLISLIVLEMGGSSRLCTLLEPGEEVVLMGPTGTPTEIPSNETVLLAGGGLGNAVLFSIALALQEKGNRVVYFAGYKNSGDLFKRHEIEKACDVVIWSSDRTPAIDARRAQDKSFVGNIVESIEAYGRGEMGETVIDLKNVDRVIAIGSDRMMRALKESLDDRLSTFFPKRPVAIGSINSPMQCMMKEICAQCLQRHVDPETGKESFVFSCFNQDQFLQRVDFANLAARLRQNSAAEKLTSLWIDHLFSARLVQKV